MLNAIRLKLTYGDIYHELSRRFRNPYADFDAWEAVKLISESDYNDECKTYVIEKLKREHPFRFYGYSSDELKLRALSDKIKQLE